MWWSQGRFRQSPRGAQCAHVCYAVRAWWSRLRCILWKQGCRLDPKEGSSFTQFIYYFLKICLFMWNSELERERIFIWFAPKAAAVTGVGSVQRLGHQGPKTSAAFPGTSAGKWSRSEAARTPAGVCVGWYCQKWSLYPLCHTASPEGFGSTELLHTLLRAPWSLSSLNSLPCSHLFEHSCIPRSLWCCFFKNSSKAERRCFSCYSVLSF